MASNNSIATLNLPSGWEYAFNSEGRIYYIDHNTKTTTYSPPPFLFSPPSSPSLSSVSSLEVSNLKIEEKSNGTSSPSLKANVLSFTLNGKKQSVENPDPNMNLNEYIRTRAGLTGTKKTCGEGGCGVCTVVVQKVDPTSGKLASHSINSCLKPLCSLEGTQILTTEGLGSQKKGFHPIQERIADFNGSQCGHCTPGWVMNMYDLLENNPNPTPKNVEDHFDGNLCRCTGYRPILDAFQSFAKTITPSSPSTSSCTAFGLELKDIEEWKAPSNSNYTHKSLFSPSSCTNDCNNCSHAHSCGEKANELVFESNGKKWIKANTLKQAIDAVRQATTSGQSYRLIVGNTSTGIYKDQKGDVLIDLSDNKELAVSRMEPGLMTFGGAVTISNMIQFLQTYCDLPTVPAYQKDNFLSVIKHLKYIANVQVRNGASWVGNMVLANNYPFPSDLCTVLMAMDSRLNILDIPSNTQKSFDVESFLKLNLYGKIIKGLGIPMFQTGERFISYKQALRHENSHALVNAAFRIRIDDSGVIQYIRIVYGGVLDKAARAIQAENWLKGKNITTFSNFQSALKIIQSELKPVPTVNGMESYRSSLVLSFFYKFWLSMQPSLPPSLQSAAGTLQRPISKGSKTYKDDPKEYPVSKAIPKVDAKLQASGEAKYTDDFPTPKSTLYASLVLSTIANADLGTIDASEALKSEGVVTFFSAKDIDQTKNQCGPADLTDEQVFASNKITYSGQPVGVIIADTQRHADDAAKKVKVTYLNGQTPILTLDEAIAQKKWLGPGGDKVKSGDADGALKTAHKVIKGSVSCGAQMHFHMEPHAVVCEPDEEGQMKVSGSLQYAKATQKIIAHVLGKPLKDVQVSTRRLGGSYGSKITRNIQSFCAVAFASQQLDLPVKMFMDFNTTLETSGRRNPFRADYQVGLDANGKLVAIKMDVYADGGGKMDGGNGVLFLALNCIDNCYYCPNVELTPYFCMTNNPPSTSMRGPGWVPAIFMIESIMEDIAQEVGVDGDLFRSNNFYVKGQTTPYGQNLKYFSMNEMWSQVLASSDYQKRKAAVETFNQANRWVKKGISLVPCKFGLGLAGDPQGALLDVLQDGSIVISHSGVEMGQGINTKVCQTAAMALGVDMKNIRIVDSSTLTVPGAEATGGSTTSELCCDAVKRACDELKKRLEPIQKIMGKDGNDWQKLIQKATSAGIDLQSKGWVNYAASPLGPWTYNSYSVAALEVELDVLTGNYQILRVDILFDCGISLNPAVDFGQIEGAFMQGIGYATSESLIIDKTGRLISNGTWEYKVPSHLDIPCDLRVSLLDNAPNPVGILSSKATGEPPLALGCSVIIALKRAIKAARKQVGNNNRFDLNAPCTVDKIQTACLVDPSQFSLQ
eukprot:TRINITY_DN3335_c0_g1_i3.p1 TRINITY_DN3335_c0_g1~~TRINITY_DN3335_c0_g1_i3.p1  ORF type:complete len:1378 (-),score=549.37 TRINITY_DN3335_c0_g1_i3:123-4256(-)